MRVLLIEVKLNADDAIASEEITEKEIISQVGDELREAMGKFLMEYSVTIKEEETGAKEQVFMGEAIKTHVDMQRSRGRGFRQPSGDLKPFEMLSKEEIEAEIAFADSVSSEIELAIYTLDEIDFEDKDSSLLQTGKINGLKTALEYITKYLKREGKNGE